MSYSTGNLGCKSILLALLVSGIEQSDLEGMQAVRPKYKQPRPTSLRCSSACQIISFFKKTTIQHGYDIIHGVIEN